MFKKFATIKDNKRTKEEQREWPCCGIRLQFIKKNTVWPRNDC